MRATHKKIDARTLAYEILREVETKDAYANLLLTAKLKKAKLNARETGLATELVSSTLRMQGLYDEVIHLASGRNPKDSKALKPATRTVLRLGCHQLLALRVPAHAAVNESVQMHRRLVSQSGAGLVNAILRRVAAKTKTEWLTAIAETKKGSAYLAAAHSHPAWIVRALDAALIHDQKNGQLEIALKANNLRPLVSLAALAESEDAKTCAQLVEHSTSPTPRKNPEPTHPETKNTPLENKKAKTQNSSLTEHSQTLAPLLSAEGISPIGLTLTSGEPSRTITAVTRRLRESTDTGGKETAIPETQTPIMRVQDQGSQVAALLLARTRTTQTGEKWLDLCAGPGGKTAVLANEARKTGATLTANEPQPHRAALVREALAQLAGRNSHVQQGSQNNISETDRVNPSSHAVKVHEQDATTPAAYPETEYTRILLDAPCSGLGALRRRPEARWRKQPNQLPELLKLQAELLREACAHLAPGGLLLYVVCTPHLPETHFQIDALLREQTNIIELDAAQALQKIMRQHPQKQTQKPAAPAPAQADKRVQLWPHIHETDAMFMALLSRH